MKFKGLKLTWVPDGQGKIESWPLGTSVSYTRDYGFRHLCRIPRDAAIAWLESVGYDFEAKNGQEKVWPNKDAYVVSTDLVYCDEVIALYHHDDSYWIQKKEFKE